MTDFQVGCIGICAVLCFVCLIDISANLSTTLCKMFNDRKRPFSCGHPLKIDTQIKVMYCEECKQGSWYDVQSIEGRSINVELGNTTKRGK